MKSIVIIGLLFTSSLSFADSYNCHVGVNLNRGFDKAFDISLSSTAPGGEIVLTYGGHHQTLAVISEATTLDKSEGLKDAFEMTLGLIAEPDVSGLTATQLQQVTSIAVYRAALPDGDETLIYRLFAHRKQIGGTFFISGTATSCLQKP